MSDLMKSFVTLDRQYTVDEVAKIVRLSTSSIYRLAAKGIIPSVKVSGSLRFLDSEIKEYLQNNRRVRSV